jgi:adenine phosphoribosyltransferase
VRLEDHIQDIPDFPKPGIVFKDITPLFLDAEALAYTVEQLAGWATSWSRRAASWQDARS